MSLSLSVTFYSQWCPSPLLVTFYNQWCPSPCQSHSIASDVPVPCQSHSIASDVPVPCQSHSIASDVPVPCQSHSIASDVPVPVPVPSFHFCHFPAALQFLLVVHISESHSSSLHWLMNSCAHRIAIHCFGTLSENSVQVNLTLTKLERNLTKRRIRWWGSVCDVMLCHWTSGLLYFLISWELLA